MSEHNIISVSGGKDSTALLLLALERHPDNMAAVFADTGNEHQLTLDYVAYLNENVFPIQTVKADFSRQIAGKREYVATKWADKGVPQSAIDRALAALVPTGIPFLDLCIWKGRFPSTMAAFCSEELKRNPIISQVQKPLLDAGDDVISWQGVRRDESLKRRFLSESELKKAYDNGAELWNYRPILDWTAEDCFAMHRKHGIHHNPLYEAGMGRVGCMPCINCRKDELLEISKRFPEEIDRIRQWEDAVKQASKRQGATFFAAPSDDSEWSATQTIDVFVEWAKTSRGGRQYDFIRMDQDGPQCSSIYVFASEGVLNMENIIAKLAEIEARVIALEAGPKKSPRKCRLPDEFVPDDDAYVVAQECGVHLPSHLVEFRDYWRGNGETKLDWQATFRNWLRKAAKYSKPTQSQRIAAPTASDNRRRFAEELTGRSQGEVFDV